MLNFWFFGYHKSNATPLKATARTALSRIKTIHSHTHAHASHWRKSSLAAYVWIKANRRQNDAFYRPFILCVSLYIHKTQSKTSKCKAKHKQSESTMWTSPIPFQVCGVYAVIGQSLWLKSLPHAAKKTDPRIL